MEPETTTEAVQDHLRRLANALRACADNPVENRLHPQYVEGFTDGMKLAADTAEQIADLLPVWPGGPNGT